MVHTVSFMTKAPAAQVIYAEIEGAIGHCLVAELNAQICFLGFFDKGRSYAEQALLRRFPHALKQATPTPLMLAAVSHPPAALPLLAVGTLFQQQVWRHLCSIPQGSAQSYAQVAKAINNPRACQAVGQAVGANPISWLIPCHRVCHSDGRNSGFGWGQGCKERLLALEARGL